TRPKDVPWPKLLRRSSQAHTVPPAENILRMVVEDAVTLYVVPAPRKSIAWSEIPGTPVVGALLIVPVIALALWSVSDVPEMVMVWGAGPTVSSCWMDGRKSSASGGRVAGTVTGTSIGPALRGGA